MRPTLAGCATAASFLPTSPGPNPATIQPPAPCVAKGLHVGHGIRQGITGSPGGPRSLGGGTTCCKAPASVGMCGQARRLRARFIGVVDAARPARPGPATFHQHLAAQQVHGLDAVRALVDHVQAVVAPVLLYREVARVAVAAVDLDGQAVGLRHHSLGQLWRWGSAPPAAGAASSAASGVPVCCSSTSRRSTAAAPARLRHRPLRQQHAL